MSTSSVEVIVPAPVSVDVIADVTSVEVVTEQTAVVEVSGAQIQTNLWVSEEYPGFTTPGLWVQLNPNGEEDTVTLNVVYDDGN